MDAVIQNMINYGIAFSGVMAIMFFGTNFLTKGFLLTYLRVKASQGKRVLARVNTASDIYYKAGKFHDGFFVFKDRSGTKKSIPIASVEFNKFVHMTMGVPVVELNEEGDKLVSKDFEIVKLANVDPARLNSLILRIKNIPKGTNQQEQIKWIIRIAIMGICLFIAWKLIQVEKLIIALGQISGNL